MDNAIELFLEHAENMVVESIRENEDSERRQTNWLEYKDRLAQGLLRSAEIREFLILNRQIQQQYTRAALLIGIRLGGRLQETFFRENESFFRNWCEDDLVVADDFEPFPPKQ